MSAIDDARIRSATTRVHMLCDRRILDAVGVRHLLLSDMPPEDQDWLWYAALLDPERRRAGLVPLRTVIQSGSGPGFP